MSNSMPNTEAVPGHSSLSWGKWKNLRQQGEEESAKVFGKEKLG
jgi:hypothetical protein